MCEAKRPLPGLPGGDAMQGRIRPTSLAPSLEFASRALPAMPKRGWTFGGRGDFFANLTWTNRPADLARSEAPQAVQDAWVAVIMAIQQAHGALRRGSCFYVNLVAAPLLLKVLGEPVKLCAGYAGFIERGQKIETGFRWRPGKWRNWIDARAGRELGPLEDIHCWLETDSHLIDFDGGTGDPADVWPPIIYRAKNTLAKHPQEAKGAGAILIWSDVRAREIVGREVVPIILPIAARAAELYDTFTRGTLEAQAAEAAQHEGVRRFARMLAPTLLGNPARSHALDHRRSLPHAG